MTSIETLMRDSNSIMDPKTDFSAEEIQAFDLLVRSRSGSMDVQELTKPAEPEKKQRSGWLVAAAAFAVVIVFVGAVVLLASPADELPPATTPPTTQAASPTTEAVVDEKVEESLATTIAAAVAEELVMTDELIAVADAYESNFNGGDVEAFRALFSSDVRRIGVPDRGSRKSLDFIVDEMTNLRRQASLLAIGDCEARSYGLACSFELSGPVELALFNEPLPYQVNLWLGEDGKIVKEVRNIVIDGVQLRSPWHAVLRWMQENHLDVRAQMKERNDGAALAYEDGEIWLEYAPLWAEAGRP